MRTYIFVRNKTYRPSTYYRLYQYLDSTEELDFDMVEYESNLFYEVKSKTRLVNMIYLVMFSFIPGYFRRINALLKICMVKRPYKVFVQRECFPRMITPLGKLLLAKVLKEADKVYWDFDDNIFDAKEITEFEKKLMDEYSDKIIVGNQYLGNMIKHNENVLVLNTTDKMMEDIDLDIINIDRKKHFAEEVILIWVGTKSNTVFLENIISKLDASAKKIIEKKLILKIISNTKVEVSTEYLIVENIKWNRDLAYNEMLKSHIGLMPLSNNEITLGKCAFKAVQAIGCGLPVVVSNVGMNKDVLKYENGTLINDDTEWTDAIVNLVSDFKVWEAKSVLSRKLWLEEFNSKEHQKVVIDLFLE